MKIKKIFLLGLLASVFLSSNIQSSDDCCEDECPKQCSRSFFMPRSVTYDSTFELALNNYHFYHKNKKNDDPKITFYGKLFYQKSTNNSDLTKYFFPNKKECSIVFAENGTGDIGSEWFQLSAVPGVRRFKSTLFMKPQRTTYGGYFNIYFNLLRIFNSETENRGLFLDIAFAAMRAKHQLNLKASKSDNPGVVPGITNVLEALNNPDWKFGKFSCKTLTESGIDDIQFKLEYDWFFKEGDNHIGAYLLATAPTGKRPTSKYIFEPIVGTKHAAIGLGLNTDVQLWTNEEKERYLHWMLDIKYRYMFSAKECRSFDLCNNGEWSRYLLIATKDNRQFSLPGINEFTKKVSVTPRSELNLWTALHYEGNNHNFEFGYNLWFRQREKIEICDDLPNDKAIYDIRGVSASLPPAQLTSSSKANISQSTFAPNLVPRDAAFTPLSENQLNTDSAAHDHTLTHKIYGGYSYDGLVVKELPALFGFNGSYEFDSRDTALSQWALWLVAGIGF